VWSSKHPLSLSIVHTSPPKHASRSMYTYLESRKVRYNLQEVKDYVLVTSMLHVSVSVQNYTALLHYSSSTKLSYLQLYLLRSSMCISHWNTAVESWYTTPSCTVDLDLPPVWSYPPKTVMLHFIEIDLKYVYHYLEACTTTFCAVMSTYRG
jgi:hypothetical protein